MDHYVTLVDQLGSYRLIVDGVDGVMESRIILQVSDVFDGSGRQVVDHQNFVTSLQICIGKMRTNEAGTASYEYTQVLRSFFFLDCKVSDRAINFDRFIRPTSEVGP
jgi:hypothetical protein